MMDEDHVSLPLTWTWMFVPVHTSFTCGADQTNQWTKDREGIVQKEVSGIAEAKMHAPPPPPLPQMLLPKRVQERNKKTELSVRIGQLGN